MSINGVNKFGIFKTIKNTANKVEQAFYDVLPNRVVNEKRDKFLKAAGRNISSAENRLILGATALMSQPFIDFFNRDIDNETRQVAVCRTIAKIVAGTTTGFAVRKGTIKLIQTCSKLPSKHTPKWQTIFTPKDIKKIDTDEFKQYQNTLGTYISLGAMMVTNFAIDAPLTKFLTNKFTATAKEINSGGKK